MVESSDPTPAPDASALGSGGMRQAVVEQIGDRIRAARQELDLSVGALAELSGVSRRMLTQIELGQANPSVAILDRVAVGLGTTFAALMGIGAHAHPDGVEVWSTDGGSWAVILDAMDAPAVSVETWKWKLLGTDAYEGGSGVPSAGRMIHVIEGALEISTGKGAQVVEAGGSGRVLTDGLYRYRSLHEAGTVFLSVALQPRTAS
ncbi:MAG: helix-turn-helix domain-containing protein [Brachybacterium sp.]|uniref:helix-turn-helix domain-containing protein n=1 Tax=Brachybacterium sp. TaxID=1891286 RepID=UPI0026481BAC|nr:helix-turn-helix domain-containing protein [Brachybacterium sp.]MDN5688705.1 helix-turn-helix domain-containing protein [Brachybacterium sp.]